MRWREDYRIADAEALELHHLYRAMAWLGEPLPETEQDARVPLRTDLGGRPWEPGTPFAPRCTKDLVEERLFAHRRDLISRLDLVFLDTTSLYFEGAGGQTLGRHGHSKDDRPDLCQMILAVLIDGDGRPVFLALVLKAELEQRLAALGRTASWTETLADLDSLTETEIAHDGKRFLVRSTPRPAASLALRAAGVALPPTVRPLAGD